MSYLNGLVVFPTFFSLSLNLAIRSSLFEAQSAPSLVFAVCNNAQYHQIASHCFNFCLSPGFPSSSAGKESPAMQETLVQFLGWEDPLEKG